ncbi:MAG: glycosyltransferase family 4 protein [Lachnospiraceae bacterium]|nr:glycosyltransferase family 4 protein [Lachnospiraceae bacterium]
MSDAKKILILANSAGGLCDFRDQFLDKLAMKHTVAVSVPDDVKKEELVARGFQVYKTPINRRGINPIEDLKLCLSYGKLMKQVKPDMVITYTIKPNIYGGVCAAVRRIPCIATITGLGGAFDKRGPLLWLVIFLYRLGLRKDACVFFQNEENRGIFRKYGIHGKKDRLVMGSGVNLSRHPYEPYPQSEEVHFLFMGRVMKERGILEYLEAAKRLHSDTVFFDIMGYCDEDYEDMLNELEKQGIIRQIGFQTEVAPYLAATSAVVIASFHEGMSNALLEAAATGRPVIASRISGCREAYEEGITGFGFTPGRADELIEAMKKFLALSTEERAQMGRAGRKKMEAEFDRQIIADAYMEEVG